MAATLAEKLAPIVLPDTNGSRMWLREFWEHGPAVLVFLRHYG
jgi:hypothetical protein